MYVCVLQLQLLDKNEDREAVGVQKCRCTGQQRVMKKCAWWADGGEVAVSSSSSEAERGREWERERDSNAWLEVAKATWHTHTHTQTHLCRCISLCAYKYACVCVCVFVWAKGCLISRKLKCYMHCHCPMAAGRRFVQSFAGIVNSAAAAAAATATVLAAPAVLLFRPCICK